MNYASSSLYNRRRNPKIEPALADSRKHKPDYALFIIMSALLLIGAVVVYAIGPGLTTGTQLPENYYSSKQIVAIGLGLVGFFIASTLPVERWKKIQLGVILAAVAIAFAVRLVGDEVNGAHRWVQVGGFSFQAAELIKFAIVLWLADFLVKRRLEQRMGDLDTLKWLGAVAAAVIVIVAGLQSDLGSAAVMLAIIGVTSYVAGLPMKKLLIIGTVVVLLGIISVVSTPYRRERITTFFSPSADCQNEGYQACQALVTVGSGGLFGKGLGRSVQAYGYLPFPENDSIFAIVAEKFGFVGSAVVILLFWRLFTHISRIAKAAPTDYMRLLATAILVWLSVQMAINIGAMIGLLPLKGITLPFVSYGGTSIIFVMVALGIIFQISRYTDLSVASKKSNNDKQGRERPTFRRSSARGGI